MKTVADLSTSVQPYESSEIKIIVNQSKRQKFSFFSRLHFVYSFTMIVMITIIYLLRPSPSGSSPNFAAHFKTN